MQSDRDIQRQRISESIASLIRAASDYETKQKQKSCSQPKIRHSRVWIQRIDRTYWRLARNATKIRHWLRRLAMYHSTDHPMYPSSRCPIPIHCPIRPIRFQILRGPYHISSLLILLCINYIHFVGSAPYVCPNEGWLFFWRMFIPVFVMMADILSQMEENKLVDDLPQMLNHIDWFLKNESSAQWSRRIDKQSTDWPFLIRQSP